MLWLAGLNNSHSTLPNNHLEVCRKVRECPSSLPGFDFYLSPRYSCFEGK